MARTLFRELPPPADLSSGEEPGQLTLGCVQYRSDRRRVGIGQVDRRRHIYLIGKTGMGKTTLLENLIRSDIAAGRGVCLIDPHGDLAEKSDDQHGDLAEKACRTKRSHTGDMVGRTKKILVDGDSQFYEESQGEDSQGHSQFCEDSQGV